MSTSVTVGNKDLSPGELARRVKFGPQTLIVDGCVFTLYSPVGAGDFDSEGLYLAIRPHYPRLFVVKPFYNQYWDIIPGDWDAGYCAELPNRIVVAPLVQYLAEQGDDVDVLQMARTLVDGIFVTKTATKINLSDQIISLLQEHKPKGWTALADAIEPPHMIPPVDEVGVNAHALVALVTHLRVQLTA